MLPIFNPARVKVADVAAVLLGEHAPAPSRSPSQLASGALRPRLLPRRLHDERLA